MADFHANTDKKVAVFLADGCEEIEALTVVDLLFRAGIPVTTVSVKINDPALVSAHGVRITADTTVDAVDFDDFDMLVLPGGMPGTPNLRACAPLMDALHRFYAAGREIAAICAAPGILAEFGFLKGRRATCFPTTEHLLEEGGAVVTRTAAVEDGNIITGRAMGCAIPFALQIITHYLGAEKAEAIRESVVA